MVAEISGSGLGLFGTSASTLGKQGLSGNASLGQSAERVLVNTSTGNLVIQHQDDILTATGLDVGVIRTYNSQGKLDDDNGDNWKIGLYRRVYGLTGTLNTAGSTVTKVFGDGAEVVYRYDSATARYVATDGDEAHDTLAWNAGASQWTWTDGSGRNTETYDAAGKLLNSKDADGNKLTYNYDPDANNLLTRVDDASGQKTYLDYTGNNLTQVRVVTSEGPQTLTRYSYDGSNRLQTVTVDLSPSDNAVSDGKAYTTTYTYDGTSTRVASITQGDGTKVSFTYQLLDGQYRVKTYTDGNNNVTTLAYAQASTSGGSTTQLTAQGLSTTDQQNVTVPAYYTVPSGATWASITQAIFGTSDANAITALQTAMGNPVLTAGLHLTVPGSITYTPVASTVTVNANNGVLSTTEQSGGGSYALDGTALALYGSGEAVEVIQGNTATIATAINSSWGTRLYAIEVPLGATNLHVTTSGSGGDLDVYVKYGESDVSWSNNDGYSNGPDATENLLVSSPRAGWWFIRLNSLDTPISNVQLQVSYDPPASNFPPVTQLHNVHTVTNLSAAQGQWLYYAVDVPPGMTNFQVSTSGGVGNANFYMRSGALPDLNNYDDAVGATNATNTESGTWTIPWPGRWYIGIYAAQTFSGVQLQVNGTPPSYVVQGGDTWQSLASTLYGVGSVDAGAALQAAVGDFDFVGWSFNSGGPISGISQSTDMAYDGTKSLAISMNTSTSTGHVHVNYVNALPGTVITMHLWVPANYTGDGVEAYLMDANYNWTNGAWVNPTPGAWNTLTVTVPSNAIGPLFEVGVLTLSTLSAPATFYLDTVVSGGAALTNLPSTLNLAGGQTVTVPAYYVVQSSDSWASITQAIYGTTNANAVNALKSATGTPTLTTGLHLTVPHSLTYNTANTTAAANAAVLSTTDTQSTAYALSAGVLSTTQTTTNPYSLNSGALTTPTSTWAASATLLESSATAASQPKTAFDANGDGFAVWAQGNDLMVSRYTRASDTWSAAVVRDTLGVAVSSPALAMDAAGNAIVGWVQSDGTAQSVYVIRYTASTSTWSTAVQIDNLATAVTTTAGSVSVSINGSIAAAAWVQTSTNNNLYAARFNGTSWSTPTLLEARTNAVTVPSIAVDGLGNVNVVWQQSDGTAESIYRSRYSVSSNSWAASATLLESSATAASQPKTAFDANGDGFAVWAQGNDLMVSRYTRASDTWSAAVVRDTLGVAVSSPALAMDTAGNAIVGWVQSDGTAQSVYVIRYTASTSTWSTAVQIDNLATAVTTTAGSVSVSINGSIAAAAWVQTSTNNNLYAARFNGTSWSTPTLLEARTNAVTVPSIAVDGLGNVNVVWQQSDGTAESIYRSRFTVASGAAYYTIPSGATWQSVANALYGVNSAEAGNALQAAMGGGALPGTDTQVTGWPATLTVTTTVTVPAYYTIPASATWQSVANTLYGINSAAAGTALQTAMGGGALPAAGTQVTGWPASLTVTSTVTVPAYYTVPAGATWASIAQGIYGTSDANAIIALQTATGSPALSTGLHLTVPATLTYTPTSFSTTATANAAVLSTSDVQTVTVTPYYTVPAGATWASITQAVYGTSDTNAVAALQTAMGNPALVTGMHLTVPATLSYAGAGTTTYLQTTIIDALNQVTTYTQDAAGRLTSVTSPTPAGGSAVKTSFAYDSSGNVTSITENPSGLNRVTTFQYDSDGNLLLSRDNAGNTVTRTYNSDNQLVTETRYVTPDPDGAGAGQPGTPLTTRYAYDSEDHLRFTISADGRVTEYRYNAVGLRIAQLVFGSDQYSVSGLAPTATLSESTMVAWAGNASRDLTTLQRTDYTYDIRGNVDTVTQYDATDSSGSGVAATQSKWKYLYDQRGQLLQKIDANGSANAINLTTPPSYSTTYTYDGLGRLLTTTDWLSPGVTRTNATQYDDVNNKLVTTYANGLVRTTVYDRNGNITDLINGIAGNTSALGTTHYTYDTIGRLRMVTDPTLLNTYTIYDAASRVVGTVQADGTLTEYVYNSANQVIKTIRYADVINATTLNSLAGTNNTTISTLRAALGVAQAQISRNIYDAAGRLVYTIDPIGAVTQTFYDGMGRVTDTVQYTASTVVPIPTSVDEVSVSQLAANGVYAVNSGPTDRHARNYYDGDGHLIGTLDAAGYLIEYKYAADGKLTQQIAYFNPANSVSLASATVDSLRPASNAKDITSYFYYDRQGRQVGVLDAEGFLTQTQYDSDGQVVETTRYREPKIYNVNFSTLISNIPITEQRFTTLYTYDGDGRVLTKTERQGSLSSSSYAQTVTSYAYDAANNLISSTRALGTADQRATQTQYDPLGRVTKELSGAGTAALTALGASPSQAQIDLVWARYGLSYTYDLAGRRSSTTQSAYDPVTGVTQATTTYFFYNTDGNLRFQVNTSGEVAENQYNALGQLTASITYANRLSALSISALPALLGKIVNESSNELTAARDTIANAAIDQKTSYTYTLRGQLAGTKTAAGTQSDYEYTIFGNLKQRTDKLDSSRNSVRTYTYDLRGLLTDTVWDPAGISHTEHYDYDAFGRRTKTTDQYGVVSRTDYDRLGRTLVSYDALNNTQVTSYDAFSRVLSIVDRNNNQTTYQYDDANRQIIVNSPKEVTTTQLNALGETVSYKNQNGTITRYTYDQNGQQLTVTLAPDAASPIISKTQYIHDSTGRTVRVIEGFGGGERTTDYVFDAAGRRTKEIVRGATVNSTTATQDLITEYRYDGKGNLTRKINPPTDSFTSSTWYVYDADNRLTYTIDAMGGVTQSTYNAAGLETSTRRYASKVSDVQMAALANKDQPVTADFNSIAQSSTEDRFEQSVYDRLGREVYKIQDVMDKGVAKAIVTKKDYDANGNVIRITAYATPVEQKLYASPEAVLVTASPAADRVQRNVYDAAGRLKLAVDAMGAAIEYQYDANGNVIQKKSYATTVPTDGAIKVWHRDGTNSSVSIGLGTFSAGDVVTATVRFKTSTDSAGAMFLGDAGDDNYVYSGVVAGNDGWKTITLTWTMSHDDYMAVFLYGNRDGVGANNAQSVLYDNLTVTSVKRGEVLVDRFESGISSWSVSGAAESAAISLTDAGSDLLLTGYLTSVANQTSDRTTRYWYDGAGRQRFALDAAGYLTETQYLDNTRQAVNKVYTTPVTVAANATLANVADIANTFGATTTQSTTTQYDAAGRVLSVMDAELHTEFYTYDSVGNKVTFTNKKNATWTYFYDKNHRLITERSPQVAVTTVTDNGTSLTVSGTSTIYLDTNYTYDALGNVKTRTEGVIRDQSNGGVEDSSRARTTSYSYDQLGRQTRTDYPAVDVFNEATGALESNVSTSSQVSYDSLGNAYKSIDASGSVSYKLYDQLGRVVKELDGNGYLTEYGYDSFGNQTTQTRYAQAAVNASALLSTSVAGHLTNGWNLASVVSTNPADPANRTITRDYDTLNRVKSVTLPAEYNFDPAGTNDVEKYFTNTIPTTLFEYNVFGQVTKERQLVNPIRGTYADTRYFYDTRGNKVAQIDAMGYVTSYRYDETGDLIGQTEYANLSTATSVPASITAFSTGAFGVNASGDDRAWEYSYDKLNRKTADVQIIVSTGQRIETGYQYDNVGNQTVVTTNGVSTTTYYDSLGRVIAIAEPVRNQGDGNSIQPLLIQRHDAFGNTVQQIQYAGGVAGVDAGGVPMGDSNNAQNRETLSIYDKLGHLTRQMDAEHSLQRFAYNRRGQLSEQRQIVTNAGFSAADTPVSSELVTRYQYDAVGQQTHVIESQRSVGDIDKKATYNAFGEVISRSVNGSSGKDSEHFEYDKLGRVFRTNSGDGVEKVYLYNLAGKATAEIRASADASGPQADLTTITRPQDWKKAGEAITITRYDLLGRVKEQQQATITSANTVDALTGAGFRVAAVATAQGNKLYLVWNKPAESTIEPYVSYREAGSAAAFSQLAINQYSASELSADITNLSGTFEYKVEYRRRTDNSDDSRVISMYAGVFIASNPLQSTEASSYSPVTATQQLTAYIPDGSSIRLQWASQSGAEEHFLEIRSSGGAWQKYSANIVNYDLGSGTYYYGIDLSAGALPSGNYDYRIVEANNGIVSAVSAGTLTKTPETTVTSVSNFSSNSWQTVGAVSVINSGSSYTTASTSATFSWPYQNDGYGGITYYTLTFNLPGQAATVLNVYDINTSVGVTNLVDGTYSYTLDEMAWEYDYNFGFYWQQEIGYNAGSFVVSSGQITFYPQTMWASWADPSIMAITPSNVTATSTTVVNNQVSLSWEPTQNITQYDKFFYYPTGNYNAIRAVDTYLGGDGKMHVDLGNIASGDYQFITYRGHDEYAQDPYYVDLWYTQYVTDDSTSGAFRVAAGSASFLSQANTPASMPASNSGSRVTWTTPPEYISTPGSVDTISFVYTGNGTSGELTPQTTDGIHYYVDFYGMPSANYNYLVRYRHAGASTDYKQAAGALSLATVYSAPQYYVGTGTAPLPVDTLQRDNIKRELYWSTPANSGDQVVFRQRRLGTSTWEQTLQVKSRDGGFAVSYASLSGTYEYEISYTRADQATPYRLSYGRTVIENVPTGYDAQNNLTGSYLTATTYTPILKQDVDRWGNVTKVISAMDINEPATTDALDRHTTTYKYNQFNQVTEVLGPLTTVLSTSGNVGPATQERVKSVNEYDLNGRLISTTDGNLHVTRWDYNAAGQMTKETHQDGGYKTFVYDAFGEQIQVTDELGFRTRNRYDHNGNLIQVSREVTQGAFGTTGYANQYDYSNPDNIVTNEYGYDQANRRISETTGALMGDNATPETIRYQYDLHGNVIKRRTPRGRDTQYEYDAYGLGKKTKEILPSLSSALALDVQTWDYSALGRLRSHRDLSGAETRYDYTENSGLLKSQVSDLGQNIQYFYDAAGHVTRILDQGQAAAGSGLLSVNRETNYLYDVAGRRVREKVTVDGAVQQDTRTTYDELGRIAVLSDLRYQATYTYDAVGNRTRIQTKYYNQNGTVVSGELLYKYDDMNRVVVSQGLLVNGAVDISENQGISLTYSLRGERKTSRQFGKAITYYDIDTQYSPYGTAYVEYDGFDDLRYDYDGLGRLREVSRLMVSGDNVNQSRQLTSEAHHFDGASRDVMAERVKPVDNLLVYNHNDTIYDDDGRVAKQTTTKNGTLESVVTYGDAVYTPAGITSETEYNEFGAPYIVQYDTPENWTIGYDAQGNLRGYDVNVSGAYVARHVFNYRKGDSFLQTEEKVSTVVNPRNGPLPGNTRRTYNVNGELVQFQDTQQASKNRYFANDQSGQALSVVQGDYGDMTVDATAAKNALQTAIQQVGATQSINLQTFLFANGQQMGSIAYGNGTTRANFDINYEPVSDSFPSSVPTEVIAQQGDTLKLIAARVYGDASLWYLIAQENGRSDPNEVITAGVQLRIPSNVVSVKNDANSFKPYSVQDAIGDTTPTQPLPPPPTAKQGGCGALGTIIMIVVAIAVTWVTAGTATTGLIGAFGNVAGSMAAAALGSAASQLVGIAIGAQDSFSWKSVAVSALTAGIFKGTNIGSLGAKVAGEGILGQAVQGAINNTVSQGVNIALGLQDKFSWRDVAISAVAAPVAQSAGKWAESQFGGIDSEFGRNLGMNLTQGVSSAAVRSALGGKVDYASVFADAFGNAIGNSIVEKTTPRVSTNPGAALNKQIDSDLEESWNNTLAGMQAELDNIAAPTLSVNPETDFTPGMVGGDTQRAAEFNWLTDPLPNFGGTRLQSAVYYPEQDGGVMGINIANGDKYGGALKAYDKYRSDADKVFANIDKTFIDSGRFGTDEHYLTTNSLIVSTYAGMGLEHPEFQWARLAAPVAYDVRTGLMSLERLDSFTDPLSLSAGWADRSASRIIQGQKDVYMDVVPLYKVYSDYGADAAAYVAGQVYVDKSARDLVVGSYRALDSANQARANGQLDLAGRYQSEAALYMLAHEQRDILQPMYNDPDVKFGVHANQLALSSTNGLVGTSYDIHVAPNLTIAPPAGSRSADISVFNTRWNIASNALKTFSGWDRQSNTHSLINANLQKLMIPQNHVGYTKP